MGNIKYQIGFVALLFACAAAQGGISIVGSSTDGFSGTGAVTGTFSTVTAEVGDVIAVTAATNKKGDVSPVALTQVGGTGSTGPQALITNGLGTYPTSWGWYQTVTTNGTFDFELTAESITAVGALHVLRADSGKIRLEDSATWDDTDLADNGTLYSLDYSFATNLTDGVVIEAVSARVDLITEPASYTEDINGSDKRLIASYQSVTGTVWNSAYTLSGGETNKQTSGAVGLVFAEGAGDSGTPVLLESWQFDDVPGGQELQNLVNSAGTASWTGSSPSITNDGLGQLVISQGSSSQYRVTDGISSGATSNGIYEMEFLITSADLSSGDASGATAGFGFRNAAAAQDLFFVRLLKLNGRLLLGTRIDGSNTTLHDFGTGVTGISNLLIRSEIDLDADSAEVFYTLDGGSEASAGTVNLSTNVYVWDQMRFIATVNTNDWGATDTVEIDYLTVSAAGDDPPSDFYDVPLTSSNLYVLGAKFANLDGNGINFHRFDSGILSGATAVNVNPVRAKTTSGAKLTFFTRSDTVKLHFKYMAGDENRNSRFGLYQNGIQVDTPYFAKTETDIEITLTSLGAPGELVRHDVVLPNWSNPILSRMEMKNGAVLEAGNPYPVKQMVVLGDSISHGTGQGASYLTYPFIAADMMNMELFNMAVGGGKIAPEVADLLQYFDPVEGIWVLAGYNDWQGSSESINSISNDYETLLTTIRTHQPDAELFCCTLTYTTNTVDAESGVTVTEVRQAVSDVVNARILAGDTNLYLIDGEAYSDASFLNDAVHFSEPGAAMFATNVVSIMDPAVNPPIVPQTSQTNIVMIVIDDLGWMDLAIQGSEFYETPRIDQLAASGMRFTQGYAAHPRCLPSRYGLMTGHFPGANGVPGGPENCLRPWETTLAESMAAGGYATFFAGKWHLIGTHGEANLPQNQGFQINISGGKPGSPDTYFYPYATDGTPTANYELDTGNELYFDNTTPAGALVIDRITGYSYPRSAERGRPDEYVTDRLTDEAIDWMTSNADQPMFLCLWHYGVHTPYEAPADLVAKYEAKLATMDYGDLPEYVPSGIGEQKMRQDHPIYAAMIESVDTNIGRLIDKVAELGLSGNTVFIFTSDNGGLSNRGGYNTRELATANYPLRTGKGWLYEGGIREAFIVAGPGVVPMVNSNAVVNGTDIFPTCLELAGLPLEPTNHTDGVSFAAALRGGSYDRGEPIFWHSPLARPYSTGDFNSSAVRDGDYKLIWFYDTPGQPYELYNVKADIGENFNLAESRPDKAAELLAMIQAWQGGSNTGTGVIFKQDADDVAKPPQPYLYNPGAPLGLDVSGGNIDLAWNDWLGYDYRVWSKTNLLDASWVLEGSGLTVTNLTLPATDPSGFYKLELMLQPEN